MGENPQLVHDIADGNNGGEGAACQRNYACGSVQAVVRDTQHSN